MVGEAANGPDALRGVRAGHAAGQGPDVVLLDIAMPQRDGLDVLKALKSEFPKLPVLWIESGLAWIPFLMQKLDHEYMLRPSEAPLLKKKPSEYMRDMYYSTQPMEIQDMQALEVTFRMMNAETQLMYSSDYPHWDFDLPSTIYDLPFLKEKAKRDILGGNAVKLFKLDIGGKKYAKVA